EDNKLLPDTRNGFRPGRHGQNNPFIVRCAIDRPLAEGKPLFVGLDKCILWRARLDKSQIRTVKARILS
ncbi:hypothetical protein FB107DRAFT_224710, partial [Schizophyllum commune]